jgi:tRNA-2-methylthio-N6-dimethylallyladenosine synthase
MNISDSQRIESKLNSLGYKSASEKEADLVVVNSCSVRQKGIDRIWGGIKKWRGGGKKILITGCVLESDRKKYAARGIEFLHIDDLPKIDQNLKIDKKAKTQHYLEIVPELKGDIAYHRSANAEDGKLAYIPIMTGCNNFCSYCAVPYTRGREVSRAIDDVLAEINVALKQGFTEVWLLGQNVNSYTYDFSNLLKKVDNIDADFKFNFISSNPQDMSDEIIKTFSSLKKWTKELHLAMQSGDDEILRKMNRKCTSQQFLELTDKLKSKIKDLKLSTDIIVGFPTETEEQFDYTVEACQKIGFFKAYINQYSPRAGTVSAKMVDDVTPEEKKRRWLVLDKLINK